MHPKLLQVLFLFIVLFCCTALRSQNTTINLLDQSGDPVSGAFWRIDSTRFGVSDRSGIISLTRILAYEDCPVNLNEGLLEMEISPYTDKFRLKKSWSEGWDRYYSSYAIKRSGKYRYLGFRFPEGTQQYAAVNDRYRVLDSRISINEEPHDFYTTFADGGLQLLALDKVRLGYDYLSPKLLKEYRFTLKDSVFVNDAYCYHLEFEPANDEPTKYFVLSKQQSVGAFSGEIFLDQKSLAIVRFKGVNTKVITRNFSSPKDRTVPAGTRTTEVNYARTGDGKWQLAEVVNTSLSTIDSNYKAVRTLYLSDENLEGGAKNASRWRYHNFQWTLRNLTLNYNEKYWSVFERSSFYQRAKLVSFDCPVSSQPGAEEFRAPFLRDTVYQPTARPMRDLDYVKEKRIRNAWEWLEDPTDSATTNYLKWENDYYDQYFYYRQDELENVSAGFSRRVQGTPPIAERAAKTDTLLRTFNGQTGAYRIVPEGDTSLLVAVDPLKPGYVFTGFGSSGKGKYYYTVQNSRDYDQLLSVYTVNGDKAERPQIESYLWRKDTLYVTGNDDLLRTNSFSRWTPANGWEDLLEEEDPTFGLRMQITPAGELILISESMTTAYVFAQSTAGWRKEPDPYPALFAGSGMRGRGCKAEVKADYVADCRETDLGTCVLAVNEARHELWVMPKGQTEWKRIALPEGQPHVTFGKVKNGQIIIDTEGVGAYGQEYYLAAARYFHRRNPLGKTTLSGYAQSAGGPILGYGVNEAPELFSAAVFDYAFLDVSGTMARPELPLTIYEYQEWGNPKDKNIREAQSSYSPYQNIREQAYPAMLFLAGRFDQSTPYWQVAKTVAALRKANTGDAPILLRTAMRGSHPGTPFGPGQNTRVERMAFLVGNAGQD